MIKSLYACLVIQKSFIKKEKSFHEKQACLNNLDGARIRFSVLILFTCTDTLIDNTRNFGAQLYCSARPTIVKTTMPVHWLLAR